MSGKQKMKNQEQEEKMQDLRDALEVIVRDIEIRNKDKKLTKSQVLNSISLSMVKWAPGGYTCFERHDKYYFLRELLDRNYLSESTTGSFFKKRFIPYVRLPVLRKILRLSTTTAP